MILCIAIGVCAIAIAGYFIRLAMDGRKERRRVREFQQDIARQERMRYEREEWLRPYPSAPDDDTTLILPGVEP